MSIKFADGRVVRRIGMAVRHPKPCYSLMAIHCGIDGCANGWLAICRDDSTAQVWWQVLPEFAALLGWMPALNLVAIDIPIGLPDAGPRRCDQESRRLLGSRRSSVFPAPIRPVVESRTYTEANEAGRRAQGKGLSKQAWAIVPKIREVDAALRGDARLGDKVKEVHPELCFTVMNAGQPMAYPKRTQPGQAERTRLLRQQFGPDGSITAQAISALCVSRLRCTLKTQQPGTNPGYSFPNDGITAGFHRLRRD